jgi:hypothetical protein
MDITECYDVNLLHAVIRLLLLLMRSVKFIRFCMQCWKFKRHSFGCITFGFRTLSRATSF